MQILELLKEIDFELVSYARQDRLSMEALERINANTKDTFSQSQSLDNECQLWSEERRRAVYRLREISREWSQSIEEIPQLKLAIIDEPIYFAPLLEKLKRLGIPILAICHNLETLAPTQIEVDPARSLFNKEIDLLTKCNLVITISREENFLLHNLGINTFFFPYYPVKPILSRLLQVREKREKTKKKGILLLGNTLNLQTRQGMKKVILFWQSSKLFQKEGKLIVAGYGTEQHLKSDYNRKAVEFLGTLSNDRLDSLLNTVRACLCYQEKGAGALTRICEMLIAGVPVLANPHAARSYYNVNGVIEFSDLNNLDQALKKAESVEGHISIPASPNSFDLFSEIKNISK